ncbi:hypothetical protein DM01DRAFT_1377691 [Hesseltinella vesiculosa]|uniref:Uncharacterized protein n=1 Tax=Hesseltinella vesiculosa TaxID=101127 RepID=A0A1X2G6D7_9FUNG|nr:hypothetical protein DM01DRAFT_1377691 [Hesseltinella vesiculosa]
MLQMELPHTSSSSAPATESVASSRKRLRPQDPVASHLSSTSKNQRMHDQFWAGVIKLTHVRGFVGPTFIKSRLKRALLTAFVYSVDFINEQFPSDISLVLVVFIQDFPERPSTDPPCGINDLPQFARDIADLLDRMQAKVKIVASVSGVFEGDDDDKKFGHPRLATAIEQIGAADPLCPPRVAMQDNPAMRKMFKRPTSLTPINIAFPTCKRLNVASLALREHWAKPTFSKSVMCDAISHHSGTLIHTKYIIATLKESKTPTSSTDQVILGWIYIGSHTATAATWGRLTLSKKKLPKLTMRCQLNSCQI